jgi:hypothetical protein
MGDIGLRKAALDMRHHSHSARKGSGNIDFNGTYKRSVLKAN